MKIKYTDEKKTVDVVEYHSNTAQEVVEITVERIRNILSKHLELSAKANEWQAALGICVTILLVLVTTNFKETFGFGADVWAAVFILSFGLCFYWLCTSLYRLKKMDGIEEVINRIKKGS